MSSRSAAAAAAEGLGIIVRDDDSVACPHGGCSPTTVWSSSVAVGYYPYSATAAFVMDRMVFHIVHTGGVEDGGVTAYRVFKDLVEHVKTNGEYINPDLIKSLIMIGTDIMRGSSRNDKKFILALTVAVIILHIEEFVRLENAQELEGYPRQMCLDLTALGREVLKEMTKLELDCITRTILFFDSRNPCSCLDQAKEERKIAMVMCRNTGCQKVIQDNKLLLCGGCRGKKYCSKACQVADWPNHKKTCKKVQKELKQAKQNK